MLYVLDRSGLKLTEETHGRLLQVQPLSRRLDLRSMHHGTWTHGLFTFEKIFTQPQSSWDVAKRRCRGLLAWGMVFRMPLHFWTSRGWHCKDCFQPWKDLVVPPLTPLTGARGLAGKERYLSLNESMQTCLGSLMAKSKPFFQRKFLMT